MFAAITWMKQHQGSARYSIADRCGQGTYDAASSIYFALRASGLFPPVLMGDCDDLRRDLEARGWKIVTTKKTGDIFVWGVPGASEDGYGHAGIMLDAEMIIHCNKPAGGISVDKYSDVLESLAYPPETIFRRSDVGKYEDVGELTRLELNDSVISVSGWQSGASGEIALVDANTDAVIDTLSIDGNGDFYAQFELAEIADVYIKSGDIALTNAITVTRPEGPRISSKDARGENFYYEIIRNQAVVGRGKKILGTLSFSNELMYTPKVKFTMPITCRKYFTAREEVRLFINSKVFHGVVIGLQTDKANEIITVELAHVVHEWQYQQTPTNLAVKDQTISDIYGTDTFKYPGWNINYLQDAATRGVDYVYSLQNKLEALTKSCENTSDLFWRVGFLHGRSLDIGSFGEHRPYIISNKPSGRSNIHIIQEPTIKHQFDSVVNVAVVYGEKSDSGMSSMSLREIYNDPAAQYPGFPVVIWRTDINNERIYPYTEDNYTALAPNNLVEYAVIDEESVAAESGTYIEGTFSFNDLAPFSTDGEEITDADRIRASKAAYDAAVKRLKLSRRRDVIQVETEQIPGDLQVGDCVRFIYDNSLFSLNECSSELQEIMDYNEWMYVTAIKYTIDKNGMEYNTLTLEKDLQIDRQTDWQ